jgi:hypothetical protein
MKKKTGRVSKREREREKPCSRNPERERERERESARARERDKERERVGIEREGENQDGAVGGRSRWSLRLLENLAQVMSHAHLIKGHVLISRGKPLLWHSELD